MGAVITKINKDEIIIKPLGKNSSFSLETLQKYKDIFNKYAAKSRPPNNPNKKNLMLNPPNHDITFGNNYFNSPTNNEKNNIQKEFRNIYSYTEPDLDIIKQDDNHYEPNQDNLNQYGINPLGQNKNKDVNDYETINNYQNERYENQLRVNYIVQPNQINQINLVNPYDSQFNSDPISDNGVNLELLQIENEPEFTESKVNNIKYENPNNNYGLNLNTLTPSNYQPNIIFNEVKYSQEIYPTDANNHNVLSFQNNVTGNFISKNIISFPKKNNQKYMKDSKINLIYLLDVTGSMLKYRYIFGYIKKANESLKILYGNSIKFGFVFYKDYEPYKKPNQLKLNNDYIKIENLSDKCFSDSFFPKFTFFEGGYDYAEDWATAYYTISQLNLSNYQDNIIVHICDSSAHGRRFSDYDDNNDQEKLLIEALKKCSEKKLKIIGLLFNEFARKSFLECLKIYESYGGYYNLLDLTGVNMRQYIEPTIQEYVKYTLKNKKNDNKIFVADYSDIPGFEDNLDYYEMKKLSEINEAKNEFNQYQFLPKLNGKEETKIKEYLKPNNLNKENKINIYQNNYHQYAIKQGNIGDCYLIASMISILYFNVPLIKFVFPKYDYDEKTEKISLYVYNNEGIRKCISFKILMQWKRVLNL